MFFPLKIIFRREAFGGLIGETYTELHVTILWQKWAISQVRKTRNTDKNFHWMKGWD